MTTSTIHEADQHAQIVKKTVGRVIRCPHLLLCAQIQDCIHSLSQPKKTFSNLGRIPFIRPLEPTRKQGQPPKILLDLNNTHSLPLLPTHTCHSLTHEYCPKVVPLYRRAFLQSHKIRYPREQGRSVPWNLISMLTLVSLYVLASILLSFCNCPSTYSKTQTS
jgi:hypothetical protein